MGVDMKNGSLNYSGFVPNLLVTKGFTNGRVDQESIKAKIPFMKEVNVHVITKGCL